ncbi:hypothetical protein sscle_11g084110 [Sclerotinia sclerotiorum 1980 UF-70]|uniref:Uncharacterized protein n=1 Tax=Sclerotinia sclerotiorum (strain ATCC 18683 / 1980 / Ss-1) TaxID=665079 RepID=A0A1D9QFG2_SCLS1|nr:hypothetical protein sscle_11g084110 [Sclerotinia sclerotiorum 1980 UF-70]
MTTTGTSLIVRDASTPHMRPHTTSKTSSNQHNSNSSFNQNNHLNSNPDKNSKNNKNNRRHSLPLHFLSPALWTSNTSTASLVESEEAARGEHILDEAKVAHRLAALRSLNGANQSHHSYAKSTGETFNQPVIVRTYSGAARPRSQQRDPIALKKQNGTAGIASIKMDMKLPPVEAFSFKGIMDDIRHGVSEDLERIAEICARSKYSLANQHEFHHPPHGSGDRIPQIGTTSRLDLGVSTLQAVEPDEIPTRHFARSSRGSRRGKSIAYGTLETIMSSSRSSDEDKSRKKPAAVLEDEVRGRAVNKEVEISPSSSEVIGDSAAPVTISERQPPPKHARSKSATFASMIIDNAQGFKQEHKPQVASPTFLVSEPARPQTSAADLEHMPAFDKFTPTRPSTFHEMTLPKPTLIRNESIASTLRPETSPRSSILSNLSSWLPWSKPPSPVRSFQGRARSGSHAEGSLRSLLRSTDIERRCKNAGNIP